MVWLKIVSDVDEFTAMPEKKWSVLFFQTGNICSDGHETIEGNFARFETDIKHWRGSFAIFETGIKHLRVCLPYLKLESNSGVGHFATFETGMKHLGGNFAIFETCSTVIKPLKGSFWHV